MEWKEDIGRGMTVEYFRGRTHHEFGMAWGLSDDAVTYSVSIMEPLVSHISLVRWETLFSTYVK